MAYERKDYSGAPADTTLSAGINNSVTSIGIASATGWPDGTNGPFFAVIDPETASEEKILVTTRTGTTLNNVTRAQDDTSAAAHDSGAAIYPCFTAVDADEANYWVAELAAAANTAGDILVADANNSLTTLAKGSNSTVLQVSSGGTQQYSTVATAMIADSAVTTAKINDGAVTAAKLAAGAAGDGWTTVTKASDESVTASTTIQNDNELLFTATSGVVYLVEACIIYASPLGGAAPALKVDFGEDGTSTRGSLLVYVTGNSTAVTTYTAQGNTSSFTTAATKLVAQVSGSHTGAGGTFRVRWAQVASDANAVTVYAGSYLRYRAVFTP